MTEGGVSAEDAASLVADLVRRGVVVRATGGFGVVGNWAQAVEIWSRTGRPEPRDLDLVALGRDRPSIARAMLEMGWQPDPINRVHGRVRHTYHGPSSVDVFFDELRMCHRLSLKPALDSPNWAVPATQLLLHKLQIVELNQKDAIDICVLLLAANSQVLSISERDAQQSLGRDWGLYVTAMENLSAIELMLPSIPGLTESERLAITKQLRIVAIAAQAGPRTIRWRARSLVGKRLRWYTEVEELRR